MTNVDTAQQRARPAAEGPGDSYDPVPAVIDWLLGVATGTVGLILLVVGAGMYTQIDDSTITDAITSEGVELTRISQAEAITAAGPFVDWISVGFIITGLVATLGAASFSIARYRTRRHVVETGGTTATFWACAIYGAALTALVSFVPGSAIVGGGLAAHLHDGDRVRVGLVAGAVGTALAVPVTIATAAGLVAGAAAIGKLVGGALLATLLVGAGLVAVLFNAGFGALGGLAAARLL